MILHVLRRSSAALLFLPLLSCGGDGGSQGPDPDDAIAIVSVSPSTAEVDVGSTVQLQATARNGRNETVPISFTWTSTDDTRATVSSSGLVSGAAEGPVTIRATADGRTGQASVAVVDPNPPPGPSGLTVTPLSDTEIQLDWTDNASNEDEYRIEREALGPALAGPARAFAQVATVGAGVTRFVDSGLDPHTAYRYRVRGCNQNGCSDFTADVEGTTPETLEIVTAALPDGVVDIAYGRALEASGGDGPPTWSVVAGALPAGLTLDAAGQISGTPSAAGTSTFTVEAQGAGQAPTRELSITITEEVVAPEVSSAELPDGGVGAPYSAQLEATRGDGSYAWALTGGSLPDGLSLDGSGAITGTPTAAGTSGATFEVTSAGLTGTATLDLTVHPALAIVTTELPDGVEDQPYEAHLVADGGDGAATWTIEVGALPEGLSLADDGTISGTPAAAAAGGPARAGSAEFVVRVMSGVGQTATMGLAIIINGQLEIATTSLPDAQVTLAYSETLVAEGGDGVTTWSVTGGDLPPGLDLGSDDGVIAGTPTAAGSYGFTVQAQSGDGQVASANLTIEVGTAPVTVTTTSLPAGNVGVAYATTLAASGGTGTYTWAVTSGSLPTGLALTAGTGEIAGEPGAAGTFEFTVEATSGGETDDQALSITVSALPPVEVLTTSLPDGTQGVAYHQTVEAIGGDGTFTWAVVAGDLPDGLTLGPSNGQITGTPTTLGTSNFTVEATSGGETDEQALSITIGSGVPLAIDNPFLPVAYSGAGYAGAIEASGGSGGYSYQVTAGALPTGLSLDPGSGAITGTAAGVGTAYFTVEVDDGSASVSRTYAVTVSGASPGAFNFHMHNIAGVIPSAAVRTALDLAVAKWEEVVTGNITNIGPIGGLTSSFCAGYGAEFNGVIVDDVEVLLNITSIDGPGGTLASAGPCAATTRDGRLLPVLGVVTLDAADLGSLDATQLRAVIFHELGHVVGLGTLWPNNGFVTGAGGADPRYIGADGFAEYQSLGGLDADVAVANTGGTGTRDAHWREVTFGAEIMTGYAQGAGVAQPISAMTIGAVADLGYTVNLGAAEAYAIPAPPPPGAPSRLEGREPLNDVWTGPVALLLPDGTVRTVRLGGS